MKDKKYYSIKGKPDPSLVSAVFDRALRTSKDFNSDVVVVWLFDKHLFKTVLKEYWSFRQATYNIVLHPDIDQETFEEYKEDTIKKLC